MTNMDPKFAANLAWSFSRHIAFGDCRRAYWFDYVATYDRDLDSALKSKVWRLRGLSSKRFLLGSFVHNAISEFLSNQTKGRVMAESELHEHLLQNVERYRRTARDTIAEYNNGLHVEDTYFDNLRTEGTSQLSMFYRVLWPPLSRLKYSQHEKLERLAVAGTPVTLKVDLVSTAPDGRVFVIDWKTGSDDDRYEGDLQVGVYALWASAKFGVDPSRVVTDLHYLRSGKTKPKNLSSEQVETIKEEILREYADFQRAVDMAANPPTPEPGRCLSCKFATVCDAADLSRLRT